MTEMNATGLGLHSAEVQAVQAIVRDVAPPCRAVAFGSRTTGKFRPYSDLDIALFAAEPLTLRQLRQVQEAFEESTLRFRVDVCDGAALSAELRAIVEAAAVLLVDLPPPVGLVG